MNKLRVACFQTTSSDIPEENIIMLEKFFLRSKENNLTLFAYQSVFLFFLIQKLK